MTTMRKRQTIDFFLAAACLLSGSVLYILFRPTTLLMFHWADSLGLIESIGTIRSHTHTPNAYLADWVIYSLPYALWVLSYLFFVSGIWGKSTSSGRAAWYWGIPIIAITSELAQGLHILPGHFDPVDLIAIIFATILGFVATELNQTKKGVTT